MVESFFGERWYRGGVKLWLRFLENICMLEFQSLSGNCSNYYHIKGFFGNSC